ncbi:pig-Q, partial [Coemansia sp. RSA 2618]
MTAMTEHIFRVFWPEHLCQPIKESGYLVGWCLEAGVVVVASKVGFANTAQITEYLGEFQQKRRQCVAREKLVPAAIVGYLSREGEGLCEIEPRDQSELWIDAFTARTQVAFRDVLSFGMAMPGRVIVTVYEESIGKPWHYYLASPINLDLTATPQQKIHKPNSRLDQRIPLQYILDHINTAKTLFTHIHADPVQQKQQQPAQTEQPVHGESLALRVSNTITTCLSHLLRVSDVCVAGVRVKKFSAVGQQLDLIVRRIMYAIEQWWAKRYTKRDVLRPHNAQYANFWNTAWVAVLDVVLGCVVGAILVVHSRAVSEWMLWALEQYTVTSLQQTIVWLRGWPAGLKLNNGLDG